MNWAHPKRSSNIELPCDKHVANPSLCPLSSPTPRLPAPTLSSTFYHPHVKYILPETLNLLDVTLKLSF